MAMNDQLSEAKATDEDVNEFEFVKARLAEIADAVEDESLSLDDALDLYEEAVSLGLQASDLLEVGVSPDEEDEAASNAEASGEGADERAAADAGAQDGEQAVE